MRGRAGGGWGSPLIIFSSTSFPSATCFSAQLAPVVSKERPLPGLEPDQGGLVGSRPESGLCLL